MLSAAASVSIASFYFVVVLSYQQILVCLVVLFSVRLCPVQSGPFPRLSHLISDFQSLMDYRILLSAAFGSLGGQGIQPTTLGGPYWNRIDISETRLVDEIEYSKTIVTS